MHEGTALGFGWYAIVGLWLLLLVGVIAIAIDSLRPARRAAREAYVLATGTKRAPLIVYTVAAVVLVVLWVLPMLPIWVDSVMVAISAAGTVGAVAAIGLIPAYLLKVVFPAPPKGDGSPAEPASVELEPTTEPASTVDPTEGA